MVLESNGCGIRMFCLWGKNVLVMVLKSDNCMVNSDIATI
jgi:hypothetical protein